MNISHTQIMTRYAQASGIDLVLFIEKFREWKQNGENSSYYFGKDGFYNPIQHGLRHVHIVPVINLENKQRWDKNWESGRRRTSDTCLVYVQDDQDYLLITILPEPLAHQIAQQETAEDKQIMARFYEIAEQFFYYRKILA